MRMARLTQQDVTVMHVAGSTRSAEIEDALKDGAKSVLIEGECSRDGSRMPFW